MILLNFFNPILDALNDGKVIRTSVAFALQSLGVLSLLGGIYLFIEILKTSFDLPTKGTIGGLLLSAVIIVAILAIVQIYFYRATNIRNLGESQFTVIPIFSILFRCFGEIYATLSLAIGVGGCLFIWFSGMNPLYVLGGMGRFLGFLSPEGTFIGGILFLTYLAVLAFITIVVFYFLAESTVVLVDIARNIRLLSQKRDEQVKT
jgi:uncharacterized membrane protein